MVGVDCGSNSTRTGQVSARPTRRPGRGDGAFMLTSLSPVAAGGHPGLRLESRSPLPSTPSGPWPPPGDAADRARLRGCGLERLSTVPTRATDRTGDAREFRGAGRGGQAAWLDLA